jgi:DNA-binding CsgD family transcriptional regulator
MAPPARPRADALASPDFGSPTVANHLLRLHSTLTARDMWARLRLLLRDSIKPASSCMEIGQEGDGSGHKIYRHAHPTPPPDWWRGHPVGPWLEQHPGAPVCRLSDVETPERLRQSLFYERVMMREGWDCRLSILSWRGRTVQGALHFYNRIGGSDFTAQDVRLAETLQPHFHAALSRVLAHEEGVVRAEQLAAMIEGLPIGLLLLDWDARPLWGNSEAAHACAVWNYGERRAAALKTRRPLVVPQALCKTVADMRQKWEQRRLDGREYGPKAYIVSEHELGLHAQIVLREPVSSPLLRPTFQVQLDYRRPRGDRNRPVSPGTVALMARLSGREVEVAMRMREGLSTSEIAAELRRSPLTIKTQLATIYVKLGVKGRTRAVALLNR